MPVPWFASLMQTAKANGVEPYAWLCHVLRELPAAKTVEQVEALLPWHYRVGGQPNTAVT